MSGGGNYIQRIINKFLSIKFMDENEIPYGIKQENGKPSVNIETGNNTSSDAFGRFRVANPVNIFENKNIHNRNKNQWEEPIVGAIIVHGTVTSGPFQVAETITGGTSGSIGTISAVNAGSVTYDINHNDFEDGETITGGTSGATATVTTHNTGSDLVHNRNNASVTIQVGISNGDSSVRTSHRYFPYIPGKSQETGQTFLFGEAVTNVRRRVGYFNSNNGLFFEQTSAGIRFVRRTKTSGSIVNNLIEQADWNEDKFDGSGPSGIDLDFSFIQFFWIDFQWQGAGRIRFGFEINGKRWVAHNINISNSKTTVYMSTASLPIRYEITNTGTTAGINTIKEFCTAVTGGGGEKHTGLGFSISNDVTARAVTTEVPVLAIRLKNTFGTDNGENRKTVEFSNGGIFATTNSAHFEIRRLHAPSSITATWTDLGIESAVEYSTDITAVTGNPSVRIEEGYAASGQAGKGGIERVVSGDKLDQHRLLTQNVDSDNSEMFIIYATSLTGTSNVNAHMSWVEFD